MGPLLEDKVAIITGAGRGIGKAIATLFANEGASVVINDLDPKPAEETANEIKNMGSRAVACPGDVVDKDFSEKLIVTAINEFGKVDILVNNAGYIWDSFVQKMTDEQWYAMIDIHVTAPLRIIRAASPYLIDVAKKEIAEGKRVHRKIINISSLAGVYGNAGQVNYSAAKAGLGGLTKALAKEWGRFNINVNIVAYGFIETRLTGEKETDITIKRGGEEIAVGIPKAYRNAVKQMIPLGRTATPQEAAGPVLFLASPLSDYITGEILICSGGLVI
jgi:3-oxoacyl-[acyl-carrier protein] reductase